MSADATTSSSSSSSREQAGRLQHDGRVLQAAGTPPSPSPAAAPAAPPQQFNPPHKALWPLSGRDIALLIAIPTILALAAGSGIGGGVLLVPTLSLVGGFNILETVALSNITILAGSVTNMVFNLPRKNPLKPGPLIDYDLLLLFGPPIVMGSVGGAYSAYQIPSWVTKALMLGLLLPLTWRMLSKAKMLWCAESQLKAATKTARLESVPKCSEATPDASCDLGEGPGRLISAFEAAARQPLDAATDHTLTLPHSRQQHAAPLGGAASCPGRSSSSPKHHTAHRALTAASTLRKQASMAVRGFAAELAADPADSSDLVNVLGPDLMFLTSPVAAKAALQVQQHSRQLHRAHTLSSSGRRLGSLQSHRSSRRCDLPVFAEGDEEAAAVVAGSDAAVASPFELQHQQVLVRQQTLRHQQTLKRQATLQKAASMTSTSSKDGAPQKQPAEQRGAAAVSRCWRTDHTACLHAPWLEAEMEERLERHASAQYPASHVGAMCLVLAVVIACTLCGTLLLTCGTWQYWVVLLLPMPFMLLVWAVVRWHVLWRLSWTECLDLLNECEIAWTHANTLSYPALCILVGVVAGLLGMGGGSVMAPMLLELGVQPAVSAATSQAAMLLSTVPASVIYAASGSLPTDYGVCLAVIGVVATLTGQVVVAHIVKRTGRSSLLVFILTALFCMATCVGIVVVVIAVVQVVKHPAGLSANRASQLCGARHLHALNAAAAG